MRPQAATMLILLVLATSPNLAVAADPPNLEKRLNSLERRIDRLEREVETLQHSLLDLQHGDASVTGGSETAQPSQNSLIGTWMCSNGIFEYSISIFPDGRLVQEEPFLSKAKNGNWSSLGDARISTGSGQIFQTDFRSDEELILTNQANQTVWDCFRKH